MSEQQDKTTATPSAMEAVATRVVQMLQDSGHVAYFAGGCVRDLVMGRGPHDYDVATSATPEQVSKLFHRTQLVGAKFGVALVRMKKQSIEVATFRTDHAYEDGRRPTGVTFSSPQEDAQRRDFTINGMFYDPIRREVIDFVGGRADISARVIRAIGDAERRFAEDHLRLLRAVRFAARLGFSIEPMTWEAMRRHAPELRKISPERIRMELDGALANPNRAEAMRLVSEAGLLGHLWTDAAGLSNTIESAIARLRCLPELAGFDLAMAALLSELTPAAAVQSLESLRCSNETTAIVHWLLKHQDDLYVPSKVTPADLKLLMSHRAFGDLLSLVEARLQGKGQAAGCVAEIRIRADSIRPEDVAPEPFVNGDDLKAMGLVPGPRYKTMLESLYYAVERRHFIARGGHEARGRILG
ncbi:MAG: CCA tRNA nucleotidyltransferase [Planctomycetes bacterium]|nr:CCA tRNA nucleotidyltransferase [Planctomycetota bacterium]